MFKHFVFFIELGLCNKYKNECFWLYMENILNHRVFINLSLMFEPRFLMASFNFFFDSSGFIIKKKVKKNV